MVIDGTIGAHQVYDVYEIVIEKRTNTFWSAVVRIAFVVDLYSSNLHVFDSSSVTSVIDACHTTTAAEAVGS